MIAAGIDCGVKSAKTVILKDGKIIGRGAAATGFDQELAVRESMDAALKDARISETDLDRVTATGSGARAISRADAQVNDIRAIAIAAHFFFPNCGTVVDVGAEESRTVRVDEKGAPQDFVVNDKCAAGAGAFIEAMSRALETDLAEFGLLALESTNPIPMNAQCAIFAESEVVGMIHAKIEKKDISRAIHDAIAGRVVSMIRRIGAKPDVVMVGGVAHNPGFVGALKRELGLDQVLIPEKPEFAAATGAALVASQESPGMES